MVSRTITMLLTMLLVGSLAFAASAKIFTWEDANGVNFTDDSSSVPEKFREKIFAEADAQPESTTPPVNAEADAQPESTTPPVNAEVDAQPESTTPPVKVRMHRQNTLVAYNAYKESMAAVRLANLEHKRSAAEATKQKQLQTKDFQNTLQSLAFYIEIVVALAGFLFVVWMVTIADIVRSKFIIPSNKTVWLLLVLLLPLIGMLPYMYVGSNYKCNRVVARNCPEPGHGVGMISRC